jgi:ABC-type bacteriocin/lantibiotic exporter with double-glycine peptidase domain
MNDPTSAPDDDISVVELYRRIWRNTGRTQILLVVLSLSVAGLAAVPLQYQKEIVNGLTSGMKLDALLMLGAQFIGFVFLNSGIKFLLNYRMSLLSEAVIRTIRTRLYGRKPEPEAQDSGEPVPIGTLSTMIAAEAEEVGRFAGAAIATPLMQVGTLATVIVFIAANQPMLGVFILAIVAPQAVIVLALQKRINARISERVRVLRHATNRIVAEEVKEVEQAVLDDFDQIYEARRKIFIFKLSSKFALNAINGLGIAGILVLGGWLVLEGQTSVGVLVASLSGMERISQPWRELITFYRDLSAVRVKFRLLLPALPQPPAARQ